MNTPQVITSGVDYVYLILPVVVVLFGWIGVLIWASSHPEVRHVGKAPGPGISRRSATEAEATLAGGAADEDQARSGERIATAEDAGTPARPGEPSRSSDAKAGRAGQG